MYMVKKSIRATNMATGIKDIIKLPIQDDEGEDVDDVVDEDEDDDNNDDDNGLDEE